MIKWKEWTGNWIGDSGAIMIRESLKTNTTLTYLDLDSDENEVNEVQNTKYKKGFKYKQNKTKQNKQNKNDKW